MGSLPSPVTFDLNATDQRIQYLKHTTASSAYSRQKDSLKTELQKFLFSLPDRKHLFSATPLDVVRFLVYKDGEGKTTVHSGHCPHVGLSASVNCECPWRLSYNTVDSYIGKLRAIFRDAGRQGDWNKLWAIGDPASGLKFANI